MKHSIATIEETWACHEMFRRMGVPADDIYLEVLADGIAVLAKQAGQNFRVLIGRLTVSGDEFVKRWQEFLLRMDDEDADSRLEQLWLQSAFCRNSIQVFTDLVDRGFKPRPSTNTTQPADHTLH